MTHWAKWMSGVGMNDSKSHMPDTFSIYELFDRIVL